MKPLFRFFDAKGLNGERRCCDDDRWILFVNGRWPITVTLSAQSKRGALAISPAIVVLHMDSLIGGGSANLFAFVSKAPPIYELKSTI
jgi:hypothetical protein